MNHNLRLMRALIGLRHFGNEIPPPEQLGISPAAVRIIDCLHERRTTTVSELSDLLRLTPPTVSVAVKKLEGAGYVQRSPGDDGRSARLELTAKGQATRASIDQFRQDRVERLLAPLSSAEREQLLTLLERMIS